MSRRLLALFGTALLLVCSRASAAQSITVIPLAVGPFTVTSAVAGQEPTAVSGSGGTYTIVTPTNGKLTTITARLSAPLPANTTLSVTLASPGSGAQSLGAVSLTTTAQPVVTGLPAKLNVAGSSITYTFTAQSAAGVFSQPVSVVFALAP